jgi:hypothetical protein
LVFCRSGHLAVALVELAANLVADNATDYGADGGTRHGPTSVAPGNRGTSGAARDGADNRACALLIARPTTASEDWQHGKQNDGR